MHVSSNNSIYGISNSVLLNVATGEEVCILHLGPITPSWQCYSHLWPKKASNLFKQPGVLALTVF